MIQCGSATVSPGIFDTLMQSTYLGVETLGAVADTLTVSSMLDMY